MKIIKTALNIFFLSMYTLVMLIAGEHYLTTLAMVGLFFISFWLLGTFRIQVPKYIYVSCATISFLVFVVLQLWQIYSLQKIETVFMRCREAQVAISKQDHLEKYKDLSLKEDNAAGLLIQAGELLRYKIERIKNPSYRGIKNDLRKKKKLSQEKRDLIEQRMQIVNEIDQIVQIALKYKTALSQNGFFGYYIELYKHYSYKFDYLLYQGKEQEALGVIKTMADINALIKNPSDPTVFMQQKILECIGDLYEETNNPKILQELITITEEYAQVKSFEATFELLDEDYIEKTRSLSFVRKKARDYSLLIEKEQSLYHNLVPLGYLQFQMALYMDNNLKKIKMFRNANEKEIYSVLKEGYVKKTRDHVSQVWVYINRIEINHLFTRVAYARSLWISIFHTLNHPKQKLSLKNIPDEKIYLTVDPFTQKSLIVKENIIYSVGEDFQDNKGLFSSKVLNANLDVGCMVR